MEIKMCRFQRSDCLEWLQFVLEVALAQARLCEVHKRWKPGEMIQQPQDETWWVTQRHSLCWCYTAAETQVQEEQIGHKNVSCTQDWAGRVRNWWLVRTHWISIPLRRGGSWNRWAHRERLHTQVEPRSCPAGARILRHHGCSGAHSFPKAGLQLQQVKMNSPAPTESSYHSRSSYLSLCYSCSENFNILNFNIHCAYAKL